MCHLPYDHVLCDVRDKIKSCLFCTDKKLLYRIYKKSQLIYKKMHFSNYLSISAISLSPSHLPSFVQTKKAALITSAAFGIGWLAFLSWRKWNRKNRKKQLCSDLLVLDKDHLEENHFNCIDNMGQQNSYFSNNNSEDTNNICYNKVSNSESVDVNISDDTILDDRDSSTNDASTSDDDIGCLSSLSLSTRNEKEVLIHNSPSNPRTDFSAPSPNSTYTVSSQNTINSSSRRSLHSFKKVIVRSRNENGDYKKADVIVTEEIDKDKHKQQKYPITQAIINKQPSLMSSNGFSYQQYQNSLLEKLNNLYGTNKLINDDEAKCLVLLLQQKNEDTLLKTVTTMCNLAAFTINQDLFRQHGAVELLINLLDDSEISSSVRLMLTQCIGNMAVNAKNNGVLQRSVPRIVESFVSADCSELQKIICIQTLTNLSVEILPQTECNFKPAIPVALERLWSSTGPNISCLKLLINLSCNPSLAHQILASKAPDNFVGLLSPSNSEDVIVRSLTLFCYLFSTVEMLNLTYEDFYLPQNFDQSVKISDNLTEIDVEKQNLNDVSPQKTVYFLIFGDKKGKETIKNNIFSLISSKNEEISEKVQRLLHYMKKIFENNVQNDV